MNRVLLVDADSKIPNLPLMKLSSYHEGKDDYVEFMKLDISYYPSFKNRKHYISTSEYDKIYCSVVFRGSLKWINSDNMDKINFGGTGYSIEKKLPDYIENLNPDYSIYPDNNISYGFISRGCIRDCYFCVVQQKEGNIHQVNTVDNIVKHSMTKFLDNNILALPNHREILIEIITKKIKCEFIQGLDIRLIDEGNSYLLSKMRCDNYIFAFDDWSYLDIMELKLPLLSWRADWQLKFFVYCHPDMEISNIIKRVEYLKGHKCLTYIMRDISCYESKYKMFYTDLARWCNQPNMYKKVSFSEFLHKSHPSEKASGRVFASEKLYKNNQ